jgi:aspartate racemase
MERVPTLGAARMHSIGILAHSADGAALCTLEMVRESARRLGAHEHPEITLSIRPMGPALPLYARGDLAGVNAELLRSAERLAAAGCAFFVCPDNTAHVALDAATTPLPLPGLHICEEVARSAARRGHRRIGLLGTRWTMEGPAYPAAFARHGLELVVPKEAERVLVDAVIFDELCQGVTSVASRERFVRIIAALGDAGCDAVALSCTEIPLLVPPEASPLPTLDSTRLLAHAAVAVAVGAAPLPEWRGGAYRSPSLDAE